LAIVSEEKKKLNNQTAQCFENVCDLQTLTTDACFASFHADKDFIFAALTARCDVMEQALRAGVQARQREARARCEEATGGQWRTDACGREALAAVLATGLLCYAFLRSA